MGRFLLLGLAQGDAQLTKALQSPFSAAREEALEAAAKTMRDAAEAVTRDSGLAQKLGKGESRESGRTAEEKASHFSVSCE